MQAENVIVNGTGYEISFIGVNPPGDNDFGDNELGSAEFARADYMSLPSKVGGRIPNNR